METKGSTIMTLEAGLVKLGLTAEQVEGVLKLIEKEKSNLTSNITRNITEARRRKNAEYQQRFRAKKRNITGGLGGLSSLSPGKILSVSSQNVVDLFPEPLSSESINPDRPIKVTHAREEFSEIVELWNSAASQHGFPKISRLSEVRKTALRKRLVELGGIEGWQAMLEIIAKSPFLLGENDRGWKISFDFVLRPQKLTALMEGNYSHVSEQKQRYTVRDWLKSQAHDL